MNAQKDFSKHQPDAAGPTADALARLTELAQQFDAEKTKLEAMRAAVTEQQKKVDRLEIVEIPKQMRLCRQRKLTTDDGRVVSIEDVYTCKIRSGKTDEALEWLARHGHAGAIKYRVGRRFSMMEQRRAQAMAARIRGQGIDPDVEKKIESSTLRRIWRELAEEGKGLPEHLFEADKIEKARVK